MARGTTRSWAEHIPGSHYERDFGALRVASARVIVAVGEESGDGGGPRGWERRLSPSPAVTTGSLGGEYGGMGKPDAFAAALRTALSNA